MTPRARGVALITALLVVAMAALAATALLSSANLAIHRTAGLRDSEQGWWVARGVEAWVLGILDNDRKESPFDALGEDWAQPVDYLPVEQGFVNGGIVDLQGRFNLNNLDPRIPGDKYQRQFRTLLRNFGDLEVPQGLDSAVRDWIDEDQNPNSMNGAEDAEYLNLTPPYRAANQRFTVPSELRAIRGMTPEIYAALQNLVTALPADKGAPAATKINVNTAEPAVLRALSETTNDEKLASFVGRRVDDPVENAAELSALIGEGIWGAEVTTEQLDFRSRYFQIRGEVFVGSSRVALYSLIHRPDNGSPVVLAHSAEPE